MGTTTTTIHGIVYDVLDTVTIHRNARGVLFYLAVVAILSRKTGIEKVARWSRIPGTGKALARDVERLGVRALNALAV